MRVVTCPVRQSHLSQQRLPGLQNDLLALTAPLLCEKLGGQGDILQSRVLGKEVEILEHQTEMEPLFSDLALQLCRRVTGVKMTFPLTEMEPPSGVSKKFRHRSSVVFPLPEEPMMASA